MKKLYISAFVWMVIGLVAGLFYRTYAQQIMNFYGDTQLAVLHTHVLVLGMIVFLVVLGLEKLFTLSDTKWFNLFFWHYTAGVALSCIMMLTIGIMQVNNVQPNGMVAGIAGLGHILITAGLVFLFVALGKKVLK